MSIVPFGVPCSYHQQVTGVKLQQEMPWHYDQVMSRLYLSRHDNRCLCIHRLRSYGSLKVTANPPTNDVYVYFAGERYEGMQPHDPVMLKGSVSYGPASLPATQTDPLLPNCKMLKSCRREVTTLRTVSTTVSFKLLHLQLAEDMPCDIKLIKHLNARGCKVGEGGVTPQMLPAGITFKATL